MMSKKNIIDFERVKAFELLEKDLQQDHPFIPVSLPRSVRLPLMAALHEHLDRAILFITSRSDRLASMHEEFNFWSDKNDHRVFLEPSPLFYEKAAWDAETRRERMNTLISLASLNIPYETINHLNRQVIFASIKSIMTKTMPKSNFIMACKKIKIGDRFEINEMLGRWLDSGYSFREIVVSEGQFSRRGGLIDIWPLSYKNPIRIELFGDAIETIRTFNPATQRSIETIQSVFIPPAGEALKAGEDDSDPYPEFNIATKYRSPGSLVDYLPKDSLIILDNKTSIEATAEEIELQAVKMRGDMVEKGVLENDFQPPYFSWSEVSDQLSRFSQIDLGFPLEKEKHPISDAFKPSPRFGGRIDQLINYIEKSAEGNIEFNIISRQSDRIREQLSDLISNIDEKKKINLIDGNVYGGWITVFKDGTTSIVFSDGELFGWTQPHPRRREVIEHQAPELVYADLEVGAHVVHIDYGIGIFNGLVHRTIGDVERDFLLVNYAEDDQLFVPVHQADRLSLYIGPDERKPRLSRLGSSDWQNAKEKVRGAVKEIANDLLELYAKRQTANGYAYQKDTTWQKILEASFPYDETEDQACAIMEVKKDMENQKPMDRLLCGDVGYGKTEVALRATFKAVMDGRQVAILVPTTVLAQQHFETFRSRLSPFPVEVEMLSRFRSHHEQEKILMQLLLGEIDIVIGTHRLIQDDVNFKDLGLLIIDEEQRFGVTHKEYFKKKRAEIDVLTLTATPIPRTLYMALTGIRDISIINSPPSDRLPIQTYVGGYDDNIVRQAIIREIDRGGQVFFVHNRVQTIATMAKHLESVVPEAKIQIAHGQMPERELAEVMHRFSAGEVDVLLSTSIIESGLDIPNANTLIVDRGDTFGLAQLYQLRGRVGRSASRAYAYFFHHRKNLPTVEGLERLETIAENTYLGAGYSIAMRDLEMRGAGDLLGTMQHGYIAAVGFHLYTRLLSQAVAKVKQIDLVKDKSITGQSIQQIKPLITVDLPFSVGIPTDYIPDEQLRLQLYRRMADINEEVMIEEMQSEFRDRFGPLPNEVENLFTQLKIKLKTERCGLVSITLSGNNFVLHYPNSTENDKQHELPDLGGSIRRGKNAYWLPYKENGDWVVELEGALDKISEINKRKKNRWILS